MHICRFADGLAVWAPAKVNLFLEILGKRADGYHELATLMVAVRLYDTLVVKAAPPGQVTLTCGQAGLTTGPDNLVMRAAHLLQETTGCGLGADIRLVKRIPMAAGLAGGSSDAAATLVGLNHQWHLGLPLDELARLGARLGSDVPFFFALPAAWCTGRGEIVKPLQPGRCLDLVLVCPAAGLATADVFRQVKVPARPQSGEEICRALEVGDVATIGRRLFNRLHEAASPLCPAITHWQARLCSLQPAGQLMSGSGTTVFALCRHRHEAQALARQLRSGPEGETVKVFQVRSCASGTSL